jgi:hypothetical protein
VADTLSLLEKNILKGKGLTDADLEKLLSAGIGTRADFNTVGDAGTLVTLLPGLKPEVADAVMAWALGRAAGGGAGPAASVMVDSPDVVYCVHCKTKQPKDYKSGDLCLSCGKQAEPILACFWCGAGGPGKFCRQCGAEFVSTAELDLAVLLKREGQAKDAIPPKLAAMSPSEKDALWGRVRKNQR